MPKAKAPHGAPKKWLNDHLNFSGCECLFWPYWRIENGYAMIVAGDKKKKYVHRLMCEHRHGLPPTPKHETAHSCGNGHLACVNPEHVSWKTHKENEADKLIHGTVARGETHGCSKLTAQDVLAIRANMSVPEKILAKRFSVQPSAIGKVKRRERWAWL